MPRHKQTAVARNRVKRRLRELVRSGLLPAIAALPPLDIVVRVAPEAYAADRETLAADLDRAAERLGVATR